MVGPRSLRLAVGTFDSWQQLRHALDDLRLRGLVPDSFNCLALRRVFAAKTIVAPSQQTVSIQMLAFPDNREPISCTCGPLANFLIDRIHAGARSLKDGLGLWLLVRHAVHFQDAVEGGKILLWIPLADAEDERRAYQCLLANSSNSVGVHDFVVPLKS